MKNAMLILMFLVSASVANAKDAFTLSRHLPGSLVTDEQVREIHTELSGWIAREAHRHAISFEALLKRTYHDQALKRRIAAQINRLSKKVGGPEIDLENPHLEMNISYLTGTFDPLAFGVSFRDGKNKFCLPCSPDGREVKWGVVALPASPARAQPAVAGASTAAFR